MEISDQPAGYDTGTGVPIDQISVVEHKNRLKSGNGLTTLPQLPSHKFQYTVWHELRSTQVKGDQLRAPRVREGPESKEKTFYQLAHDSGELIHHDRKGKERKNYRDQQENWESALKVNLSFQKLEHSYQVKNFMRILRRLKSVEDLTAIDNSLHDLSAMSFNRCQVANFSKNFFSSFKMLPSMPNLRHLIVSYNQIKDLSGLNKFSKLEYLEMAGNGIYFSPTYRRQVFKILPQLKVLDKTIKMESDVSGPEPGEQTADPREGSTCVIM